MADVWVVDDDQSMRWVLERALAKDGLQVASFTSATAALAQMKIDTPRVVVSDIQMPGGNGLDFLQQLHASHPHIPVIIMTAYSDLDSAVAAFQGGAFEYLAKPFDLNQATELVRRALAEQSLVQTQPAQITASSDMIGKAPAMQELFRAIGRLSGSNTTVMITGESGSGKELVALALHRHSSRSDKPFVALNTAAIPRDLLESELFGHERGSFTGAQQQRRGRFEQADGGTLFLDEIGDMPAELQTRLLRVLSDSNFYRVGGHSPIKTNVRVIAATHQNLEERVAQGLFREDLFHRLNVIRLKIPSLRERREDISLLVAHFMHRSAVQLKVEQKRLTDQAIAALSAFSWPGNVRQLENTCHWINVMAPGQVADVKDLPLEIRQNVSSLGALGSSAIASSVHGALSAVTAEQTIENEQLSSTRLVDAHVDSALATQPINVNQYNGSYLAPTGVTLSPAEFDLSVRPSAPANSQLAQWDVLLREVVKTMLAAQPNNVEAIEQSDMMDLLTRQFENAVITTTLRHTRGRRIESALRLGIGRNTITRKIQDLGIDE